MAVRRFAVKFLNLADVIIFTGLGITFIILAVSALGFGIVNLIQATRGYGGVSIPIAVDFLTSISNLLLVLIVVLLAGSIRTYLVTGETSAHALIFICMVSVLHAIIIVAELLAFNERLESDVALHNYLIEIAVFLVSIPLLSLTLRLFGTYPRSPRRRRVRRNSPPEPIEPIAPSADDAPLPAAAAEDEAMPAPRRNHRGSAFSMRRGATHVLEFFDAGINICVTLTLLGLAAISLIYTVTQFELELAHVTSIALPDLTATIIETLSILVLVLILLELIGIISAYLSLGEFSLRAFFLIALIVLTHNILEISEHSAALSASTDTNGLIGILLIYGVYVLGTIAIAIANRLLTPYVDEGEGEISAPAQ